VCIIAHLISWFSLERILKRDVDLLESRAIRNPYLLKSIDSAKQLVYEA